MRTDEAILGKNWYLSMDHPVRDTTW